MVEAARQEATFVESAQAMLRKQDERRWDYLAKELEKHISPSITFDPPLSKLLDERRLQYKIHDACFDFQPPYDRVLVYQIPFSETGAARPGSPIIMTDKMKEASDFYGLEGVIVSAGLLALEHLRTNGMDLGHRIMFATTIVRKMAMGYYADKPFELLVMSSADIQGSYDTRRLLREKKLRIAQKEGSLVYESRDPDTLEWSSLGVPMQPPTQAEYM